MQEIIKKNTENEIGDQLYLSNSLVVPFWLRIRNWVSETGLWTCTYNAAIMHSYKRRYIATSFVNYGVVLKNKAGIFWVLFSGVR